DDPPSWEEVINPKGHDTEHEETIFRIGSGNSGLGGTLSWRTDMGDDRDQTDGKGATAAIQLLKRLRDRPFFLVVGFYRPHTPYVSTKLYFDLYPLDSISLFHPSGREGAPEAALTVIPANYGIDIATQKHAMQAYHAAISLMDAQVGRVLDAL